MFKSHSTFIFRCFPRAPQQDMLWWPFASWACTWGRGISRRDARLRWRGVPRAMATRHGKNGWKMANLEMIYHGLPTKSYRFLDDWTVNLYIDDWLLFIGDIAINGWKHHEFIRYIDQYHRQLKIEIDIINLCRVLKKMIPWWINYI